MSKLTLREEVCIQTQDFNVANEYECLSKEDNTVGAVVFFVGKVREDAQATNGIIALELEHYPAMTKKVLQDLVNEARARWQVCNVRIVHRVGKISVAEQIVFVGVTAEHRATAFECAEFLMDYLKTKAPFWKKSYTSVGSSWVKAKNKDKAAVQRWQS